MGGRLKKPSTPEPAPDIEESGSPEATMATATTMMMAVIKRSNIIFPSWSSQTLDRSSRQAMLVLCFGRNYKLHAAVAGGLVMGAPEPRNPPAIGAQWVLIFINGLLLRRRQRL